MHTDRILQMLREDLTNERPSERQNALNRLSDLAPPGAMEWVVPRLTDSEESVRIDALICLRELRDPASIPYLIATAKQGGTPDEREFAVLSLGGFTSPDVRDCLVAAFTDPSLPNTGRMKIVMQLWRYPDESVIKILQDAVLTDLDHNVRLHAADSLTFLFRSLNCPKSWRDFWTQAQASHRIGVEEIAQNALNLLHE